MASPKKGLCFSKIVAQSRRCVFQQNNKATFHKCVPNVSAVTNPTPMSKSGKYKAKTKITSFSPKMIFILDRQLAPCCLLAEVQHDCNVLGQHRQLAIATDQALQLHDDGLSHPAVQEGSEEGSIARAQEGIKSKGNIIDI